MGFFLPLLIIVGFSLLLLFLKDAKIGYCIPLSFMCIGLILYLTTLAFHSFYLGVWLVCACAFLGYALLAVSLLLLRKTPDAEGANAGAMASRLRDTVGSLSSGKSLKVTLFIIGLFVLLYVCIYIWDFGRSFSEWDEFAFWGPMVQQIMRLGDFYSVAESTLTVHKYYPPFFQLFEAFWCYVSGGYSEPSVYKALHTFLVALWLVPLQDAFNARSKSNALAFAGCIVFIPAIMLLTTQIGPLYTMLRTTYVDTALGILAAFALYLAVTFKRPSIFRSLLLGATLSCILLAKQMGLAFYALTIGALLLKEVLLFCKHIWEKKRAGASAVSSETREGESVASSAEGNKSRAISIVLSILLIVVVPFAMTKSWDVYTSSLGLSGQFNLSAINLNSVMGILQGTAGEQYQVNAAANFLSAITGKTLPGLIVSLTYVQYVALGLFVCLISFLPLFVSKHARRSANPAIESFTAVFSLAIGAVGYACALLLLYIFCFGPYEGPSLASFDRYIGSYILAMFTLAVFFAIRNSLIVDEGTQKPAAIALLALLTLALFVIVPSNFMSLQKPVLQYKPAPEKAMADTISQQVPETASVFIINQKDTGAGFSNYKLAYYLPSHRTNGNGNFRFGQSGTTYWTRDLNASGFSSLIYPYDYVYIIQTDDELKQRYGTLFEDETQINDGTLFQIVKNEAGISLKKVGS